MINQTTQHTAPGSVERTGEVLRAMSNISSLDALSTAQIAERVKQLRLLTLAEKDFMRNRAASWVTTGVLSLMGLAALVTVLAVLGRVLVVDFMLAGCR